MRNMFDMRLGLSFATLRHHPARSILAIAGIAVAAALLLDMVMLATGMTHSFRSLLLVRGYQLRVAPKGTLPFDSEATIEGADAIAATLRRMSSIVAVSPVLGASVTLPDDSLSSTFAIGIEPDVQGDYVVERGRDIGIGPTTPRLMNASVADSLPSYPVEAVVSSRFLERSSRKIGDTITIAADIDAQLRQIRRSRRAVITGMARFHYVPNETPVIAIHLAELRGLLGREYRDRVSLMMAQVASNDSASVERARLQIAEQVPGVTAISTETAIRQVEERLSYFRQLAFVLGAISLSMGFLLVSTILAMSVNERRGEIAVMRAIGVQRTSIIGMVMLESVSLSALGTVTGMLLGVFTARWLNTILGDFPGLPPSFDFFVWSATATARSMALLLVAGVLAGIIPAWNAASMPVVHALREEAVG